MCFCREIPRSSSGAQDVCSFSPTIRRPPLFRNAPRSRTRRMPPFAVRSSPICRRERVRAVFSASPGSASFVLPAVVLRVSLDFAEVLSRFLFRFLFLSGELLPSGQYGSTFLYPERGGRRKRIARRCGKTLTSSPAGTALPSHRSGGSIYPGVSTMR